MLTGMVTNADLSANIRVEIARQRRTYQSVADAAGIDGRAFRARCREEAHWTAVEIIAVAHALGMSVEKLATGTDTNAAEKIGRAVAASLGIPAEKLAAGGR